MLPHDESSGPSKAQKALKALLWECSLHEQACQRPGSLEA